MRSLHLVTLCSGASLCGCTPFGPASWHRLPDGRKVPDQWTLDVTGASDPTKVLRYDALYVSEPGTVSSIYHAQWYRFWADGRVALWFNYTSAPAREPLAASDGDDLFRSLPGRYRVAGDQLTMEFLGFDESGAQYIRHHGGIRPDGAIVLSNDYASRRKPKFGVYHPLSVGTMTRQPDW